MALPKKERAWGRIALYLTVGILGGLADLFSKKAVFAWLGPPGVRGPWWIWEGYVGFETSINTGALAGIGQDKVEVFAAISFVALLGINYWVFIGDATRDWLSTWALGLIVGGVVGNLYDRLGIWGQRGVRDWILLRYEQWTWPNFNIADSLLVCGAFLLVWHAFRTPAERHESAEKEPAGTAANN